MSISQLDFGSANIIRGFVASFFIFLLSIFLFPSLVSAATLDASGSGCLTIGGVWDSQTSTCALTANVTESITIQDNGITLDGGGFSVTGSDTGVGVSVGAFDGVTIRNLTVENWHTGIALSQALNAIVENVTATSSVASGIHILNNSDSVMIEDSILSNNYSGVLVQSSKNITVRDSEVRGNVDGIEIQNNANDPTLTTMVTGNFIHNNIYGLYGNFTHAQASNNTFENNSYHLSLYSPPFPQVSSTGRVYNNSFLTFKTSLFYSRNTLGDVTFYNDPPIGGNYWMNYDETIEGCDDSNSNGFCDSTFDYSSGWPDDQYPWVEDGGWETPVPMRTPVLIVPGILGSELLNGNDLIWADLDEMFLNIDDEFIVNSLALDRTGDSINQILTGEVIQNKEFLGIEVVNTFRLLREELESSGYVLNQDVFFFSYDWRLDLEITKEALNQKISAIKTQSDSQKVDIAAHSMGGLLTKMYLEAYGNDSVQKLIFIGTPHLGTPKSGKVLLEGDQFNIPWLEPERMKELGRNSISSYELLPNQKYFDLYNGYIKLFSPTTIPPVIDYSSTKNFLLNDNNLNSYTFGKAEEFFLKELHNYDFSGIETYNIAGCKQSTPSAYQYGFGNQDILLTGYATGDETVVLGSADHIDIPTQNKFYVKDGKHSELPSTDGVRQLVTQILSDGTLAPVTNVSNSNSFCTFRGKQLIWRSPVAVHIYDSQNNHTGPIENNAIEYGIDGISYDIIDGHTFIFLPTDEGQTYSIAGRGTDNGTFDLLISDNDNGAVTETNVFNDVTVTPLSIVNFSVSSQSTDEQIQLDLSDTGQFQIIQASAVLNPTQSEDLVPPETSISIVGTQGTNGWYKSDVTVSLSATDDNSGVLETRYSLDSGSTFVLYTVPFAIAQEGTTHVQYYSVDNAGNNEIPNIQEIKIDKTAPEISISYNISIKNFSFISIDSVDPNPAINCTLTTCIATDSVGNTSKLVFENVREDTERELRFRSISYQNQAQVPFSKDTEFEVEYIQSSSGTVKDFDFELDIGGKEYVNSDYDREKNRTVVYTLNPNGTVTKQVITGIKKVKLQTTQGNLTYQLY